MGRSVTGRFVKWDVLYLAWMLGAGAGSRRTGEVSGAADGEHAGLQRAPGRAAADSLGAGCTHTRSPQTLKNTTHLGILYNFS